tara:strand:+ start:866 stop:2182 length:1317 start_codon:yes stop_codon:yes gene_type:complete
MNSKKILIKNGHVVDSQSISKKDILINNGIIESIGENLNVNCDKIIDAQGLYIMPGGIDPQVHFREPGLTHKETIESGSRAAVAGGITSFFEMPNTKPATITSELLEAKFEIASKTSVANFSFFLGATPDNFEEVSNMKGNCGLKIFMGSSTGDLLVDNDKALDEIFRVCNKIVAVHAEDEDILKKSAAEVKGTKPTDHPAMRPVEAAVAATQKAIDCAIKYKKRLHILHLSTAEEVDIIRKYKDTNLITAETTPQHLLLHAPEIYEEIGAFAQMNPPIREKYHKKGLWEGLLDGTINCIATDHAPHTIEEKKLPFGQSPAGMPGVETSLPLMLNHTHKSDIDIKHIVKWMCENPAKIYNIKNKGYLREGYDADITLVDLNKEKVVSGKNMQSKCGWSAFDGKTLKGWPVMTIVNGNVVFENEQINDKIKGKKVIFDE